MKTLFHLGSISLLIALSVACTKSPEPKLPDAVQKNIFPISQFDGTEGELSFSDEVKKNKKHANYKAYGEFQYLKVKNISIPGTPQEITKELFINARSHKKLKSLL